MNAKAPASEHLPVGTVPEAPATAPSDALVGPEKAAPAAPDVLKNEASALTAEEQMARFEKELKENDWGHQPC